MVNPHLDDLRGKIWEPWQDMALVLCLWCERDRRIDLVEIPEDLAGMENLDREVLMENARDTLLEKALIRTMPDMLRELADGMEEVLLEDDFHEAEGMVVVTSDKCLYGASVITHPKVQKELQDRLGDFYIIPSSRHEVIYIAAGECAYRDTSDLNNMIMQVNIAEVETEDWLGDHAYLCRDGIISQLKSEAAK